MKKIYLIAAIVVAVMLLFPPFAYYGNMGSSTNIGYAFIFSLPLDGYRSLPRIDWPVLLTQWIGVVLIVGFLRLSCSETPKIPARTKTDPRL